MCVCVCVCVCVFGVCVCVCARAFAYTCSWWSVCFSCKLMGQNEYITFHYTSSNIHTETYQSKQRGSLSLSLSLALSCVIGEKSTHRCREELAHQVKPSTHYSMHAIHNQLRGRKGVKEREGERERERERGKKEKRTGLLLVSVEQRRCP